MNNLYLSHHGILGQKWGVQNGPPYPLSGGDYSQAETKAIYRARRNKNSIYNKKHFDKTIPKGSKLATLSYDPERTKDADMFYATYKTLDKHQYNALFNKPVKDIDGSTCYKYRIQNAAKSDIKVASEDSAAKAFEKLYSNDRDFYNFVTDRHRMQDQFVTDKYRYKGYRESAKALEKIRSGRQPSDDDLKKVYRMFNYTIPADGGGNQAVARDVANQRAKFFKELKRNGYGAVLDTNDAIYGSFKATAPVIVFDMESVALKGAKRTTVGEKRFSTMALVGRKVLGI